MKLSEIEKPCVDCGKGDTLPVGKDGEWVCVVCASKPERALEAVKRTRALANMAALEVAGLAGRGTTMMAVMLGDITATPWEGGPCYLCGTTKDTEGDRCRPFGEDNKPICANCCEKPEYEAVASKNLFDRLGKAPLIATARELTTIQADHGGLPPDAFDTLVVAAVQQIKVDNDPEHGIGIKVLGLMLKALPEQTMKVLMSAGQVVSARMLGVEAGSVGGGDDLAEFISSVNPSSRAKNGGKAN